MRSGEPFGIAEPERPGSREFPDEFASVKAQYQSALMITRLERKALPLANLLGAFRGFRASMRIDSMFGRYGMRRGVDTRWPTRL